MKAYQKLKYLEEIIKEEANKVIKEKCKVIKIFIRRDGFQYVENLKINNLTNEDFSILTTMDCRMPIVKKMKLMADEPYPPYIDENYITFRPIKYQWKKNTLEIIYKENY